MEIASAENVVEPTIHSNEVEVQQQDPNISPAPANQGSLELKVEVNEEEVKSLLELTASTGRYWCDWNHLKRLLSFKLKQVLSEYPEANMTDDQQIFSLGETYPELVRRIDNVLNNFVDGPPFTLQRLCEILLGTQSIYPKLSKLVLAVEKNLLVTSTLAISTDPHPSIMPKPEEPKQQEPPEKESEEGSMQLGAVPNGVEPAGEVKDEIMTEVEEADADASDAMTIDTEVLEDIGRAPNPNSNL